MRLLKTISGLRSYLSNHRTQKTIGLVPTMGALHPGHLSLIERACQDNQIVVVSIFINPLQFSPQEDLDQYPHSLEKDHQLCQQLGVEVVFAPSAIEMGITDNTAGSSDTTMVMPPANMISGLCAPWRPVHFPGVATVVTRLLNIVQPTTAYFGEKDAQQLAIIRRLVADLKLPVEIKSCPIVREASGLAYSSRNQYLSPEQKQQAKVLFCALSKAQQLFETGEIDSMNLISAAKEELALVSEVKLEYLELVDPQTLIPIAKVESAGLLAIACWLGSTRLIDNVILRQRKPIIAIDGPAGAGKSTVARLLAQKLGLLYLDTGAMYRAVTWLLLESGIELEDQATIAEVVSQAQIQLLPNSDPQKPVLVKINGKDVTQIIRTPKVTAHVSPVSQLSCVRQVLVAQQRKWGETGGVVAEGRDIGTNVFPQAELKIFLTASVSQRAKRRWQDLQERGENEITLQELIQKIEKRDLLDSSRSLAPLRKADSAIEINTDNLTIEQVVEEIARLYSNKVLR